MVASIDLSPHSATNTRLATCKQCTYIAAKGNPAAFRRSSCTWSNAVLWFVPPGIALPLKACFLKYMLQLATPASANFCHQAVPVHLTEASLTSLSAALSSSSPPASSES